MNVKSRNKFIEIKYSVSYGLITSECFISAKLEPLRFRNYLLNLSFSRPFELLKINSTESYENSIDFY